MMMRALPLLSLGLAGCQIENGINAIPGEPDAIPVHGDRILEMCQPPDVRICPLDPETGDYAEDCREIVSGYQSKFATASETFLSEWESNNNSFTNLSYHDDYKYDESVNPFAEAGQFTLTPGDRRAELSAEYLNTEYDTWGLWADIHQYPSTLPTRACGWQIISWDDPDENRDDGLNWIDLYGYYYAGTGMPQYDFTDGVVTDGVWIRFHFAERIQDGAASNSFYIGYLTPDDYQARNFQSADTFITPARDALKTLADTGVDQALTFSNGFESEIGQHIISSGLHYCTDTGCE